MEGNLSLMILKKKKTFIRNENVIPEDIAYSLSGQVEIIYTINWKSHTHTHINVKQTNTHTT